jgi:hypothetical protein
MYDTPEEAVERYKNNAYALQFTNGTREEYETLFEEAYPEPRTSIECTPEMDVDALIGAIADELGLDIERDPSPRVTISSRFSEQGGSIMLYEYDQLDDDTARFVAQYMKGVAETARDLCIAYTVEDTDALYRANPDLSGRVRPVDFSTDEE